MGPNRSDSHREEHSSSALSRHGLQQQQQQQQLPPVSTTPMGPQASAMPAAGPPISGLPTLPASARSASPNNISWLGTCDAAPPSVLSCQKLEASLQLQSMRTIQTAPPPFPAKYDCDGRPLADVANQVNFLNQEGGLSRDFGQFGVNSVPSNYYHRQAAQENHFGHVNQPSLEAQASNFHPQAAPEPSHQPYQHQQSQLTTDATVLRQQNPSGFSSAPPLYRQSHLSADAPPFCHQAPQSEQSTFQPPVGTPSYLQNQPPVETIMYQHQQHQNQLPIEPPLYQRPTEGPVYHQTNQTGPEPTLYHRNQPNIETPLYHQTNQRPPDTSTFRDQHHSVQERQIFHQTLSAVEAALYRNHHPTENPMFHQQNQTGSEPSPYHSNQQGSDSTVYHRQEAALYHHPTPPPHFVHQNQASGPQVPTFYHQNQAVPESNSFYRFQNQTGDSHFQRPSQPNTAFYHLQNQTEAQYHQQNSSDSSFHLLQNQRPVHGPVEPQLQSSAHHDGAFYSHRNLDVVDPQLCQQNHSSAEAQLFQFQNQAAQENQLHHQNRSIAEVPGFSFQAQVTQDTRVHPPNHGPIELSMANFQNQSAQEAQLRHQNHSEVPVYHYQGQVTQDVQLHQQNPNATDLPIFHYQNQATQGAQFHQSTVAAPKSSALYHQKSAIGETKIHQNSVLSLTKPSHNWEAAERKSHKIVATEANMPFVNPNGGQFPCLPANDPRTVLSVMFPSKGSPTVTGQFQQDVVGTEKVNAYRHVENMPELNISLESSRETSSNRAQHMVRGNRNEADADKEDKVVSGLEKDIEGIHLDHNRNTLKPNSPHLPTKVDEIKGNGILAEKKEAFQDSHAEPGQNIQERSNLYSNGIHTFNSHDSTKATGDLSNQKAQECDLCDQNLDELDESIFEKDRSLNLDDCPNSRSDEDEDDSSQRDNHSPFSPRFEDKSSSSGSSDWTAQGQSNTEAAAEVNQNEELGLEEVDEAVILDNFEENFTVSNAHLLPRPPDILLTLPADVENESEVDDVEQSSPGIPVQPSSPSNQLSQDGSDELGPALELLFDGPEEIDLPLSPPPTPPVSPPLVTPPCSPPLSSAPSSPRSSTPPFSSPLSSSPHVGDGVMQGGQSAHWEPFKLETQPLFPMLVLEKLTGSKEKDYEAQEEADLSSEQPVQTPLPEDKPNAELDSLLPEEERTLSVQRDVSQQPPTAPEEESQNSVMQNGSAGGSNDIDMEENLLPVLDQSSQQLWSPTLGSTTWSHHQEEDLHNNSCSPQANLVEQPSTQSPLPKPIHQLLPQDQNEELKDGCQTVNVDFCQPNSREACLLDNSSEVESSPYFVPIRDEISMPPDEIAIEPEDSEDFEAVSTLSVPARADHSDQDSSPSPSSMMASGFNSSTSHCLRL